jgi:hypothetical protein
MVGGSLTVAPPIVIVRSSWVVIEGVVWPADALPKPSRGQGPTLNRTREILRRSIALKGSR